MSGLDNSAVQCGVVKFFNATKQYGFIIIDDGPDVFFHMSDGAKVEADSITHGAKFCAHKMAVREPKAGDQLIFVPTKGLRNAAQKAKPWGYAIEYEESLATLEPVFKHVDVVHKQATAFVNMLMQQPESMWYHVYVTTLGLTRNQLVAREIADRRLQDAFRVLNGDKHTDRQNILMKARIPLDIIIEVLTYKCELSRSVYVAILKGYESILPIELLRTLQERIEQAAQSMYIVLDLCDQYYVEIRTQEVDVFTLETRLHLDDWGTDEWIPCPHGGYYKEDLCPDCRNGDM